MPLGQLASSGAAALTIEGAAVSPEGRTTTVTPYSIPMTPRLLWLELVLGVRAESDMPIGIEIEEKKI